jgi:DNA-binding MarR family transcriptional regulator
MDGSDAGRVTRPVAVHPTDDAAGDATSDATPVGHDVGAGRRVDGGRPSPGEVDAVMWAAQLLVAISARSLAAVEAEVSLPQLRVLVILASQGAQSLNAVAHSLSIHPSNATRACDKLVVAGLIHRGEDPSDRRAVVLELTGAGIELVEKVMRNRRDQVEEVLSGISASERRALTFALNALESASGDRLNQAAWQAGWTTAAGVGAPSAYENV